MRRGWVVASCGWQCDLPPEVRGLFRLHAPEALGADWRRLMGRVYVQLQAPVDVPHFLLSDRGHAPYEAADLRRARRRARRARPARRRIRDDSPLALALRPRAGRPPGARPAVGAPGRRLHQGPALPDRLHGGGRAGAGARPGGPARVRGVAPAWRRRPRQPRPRRAPAHVCLRPLADGTAPAHADPPRPQRRRGRSPRLRRDHRQRGGRDARRVQRPLRPELQGPRGDDGPLRAPARRAPPRPQGVLHEHVVRVPPRRRLAGAHRRRRRPRRRARPRRAGLSLHGDRARPRHVAALRRRAAAPRTCGDGPSARSTCAAS